jgi:voltage-gated potassium channel Kch
MSSGISPNLPVNAREVGRWDAEHDVLIVGFGAAIEAARAGAATLSVECATCYGGTSALIYLGGSGGTPAQHPAMRRAAYRAA